MSKWDQLKVIAQNASATGGFGMKLLRVEPRHILELISIAERACSCNKPEDNPHCSVHSKPKTIVEEIREEIGKREEGLKEGWNEVAEALLEAVEELDYFQTNTIDGLIAITRLKRILAILKKEKTRDIPNPKTEAPEPQSPKQIGDKVVKELMELNNIQDAKALFSRLLGQVWGGSGSQIQRLRGNIEYEISLMQDKDRGAKILKWFDLYEKGK